MICNKCGIDKLETEEYFSRRSDNGKLRGTCKECAKKYNRERYKNYYKEYHREYYLNNKEQYKQFYQKNKEKYNKDQNMKYSNDPIFKLRKTIQSGILRVLKYNLKSGPTAELLGCTGPELKLYLEAKFQPGMIWENHNRRGWHIDHIKPCISFDLSKPEEQRKCFHYTNLQPLWAEENIKKGGKILE